MKKWLFFLPLMIFSVETTAVENPNGTSSQRVSSALSDYAWEKRQLIVFAPTDDHEQYQLFKQVQSEFSEDLKERKLHTWHVISDNLVKLDSDEKHKVSNQDFREVYGVDKNEFRLLLVGYDQGEKLRQKQVNIDFLFSEIDQMPMRMQEMQSGNN